MIIPSTAIIYDCEYWTNEGALQRRWSGLEDYPPLLVQLYAVKVDLRAGLNVLDEYSCYVKNYDRQSKKTIEVTEYFTNLTGISQSTIERLGKDPQQSLRDFHSFSTSTTCYSYYRDDEQCLTPTNYYYNLDIPFDWLLFSDIRKILIKSGVERAIVEGANSGTLAEMMGLDPPTEYQRHDARYDVHSIVKALRHLNQKELLNW